MIPLSGVVLTAAEMRAAELASGVALPELMERAGTALAEAARRFGGGAPILILCGPGNNGGDGYVAARVLAACGAAVRVAAIEEPRTELARAARQHWSGPVEPSGNGSGVVIVDALFGTGLTRILDGQYRAVLMNAAAQARLVIAADLPSGVGSDDGADLGAVRTDITIAFGVAKPAHLLQPAAGLCGRVMIADIGIKGDSKAAILKRPALPAPGPADHKYTRGYVVVVGGAMPGAAAISANAALHSGAGYVVLTGGKRGVLPNAVIRSEKPVAELIADSRVRALLIGPGLGRDAAARAQLDAALASDRPLVLDADALNLLGEAKLASRSAPAVLTPHAGEFTRLFGESEADKLTRARDAAMRTGATIVFKGTDTVIASPDGRGTLAPAASNWLATAGTGDVLAGIVAAMLARGMDPYTAACAAVWLHGEAARRAGAGLIADDLSRHLGAALASCI